MSAYAKLADLAPLPIWTGVLGRAVVGERMTLAVVELDPGCVVPEHQHPNEQLGIVLKGSLTFTIAGETRRLVAGDTYNIPSNVPHTVTAGSEGGIAVDVFSPLRSDWAKFAALSAQRPQWP